MEQSMPGGTANPTDPSAPQTASSSTAPAFGAGTAPGAGGQKPDPVSTGSAPSGRRHVLPIMPSAPRHVWSINVCPTTGGQFQLCATPEETIDGLKKTIAKRLKLSKERITLLCKERVLKQGSLRDNGVIDGCKLTLLPNIESGLMSQRPEHTVMQALENLSDTQVNDFLSGKSPLTLAMRLGDHMMFVQLQLSTSPPTSRRSSTTNTGFSAASPVSTPMPNPAVNPVSSLILPTPPTIPSSASPLVVPCCTPSTPSAISPLGISPFTIPTHQHPQHHCHPQDAPSTSASYNTSPATSDSREPSGPRPGTPSGLVSSLPASPGPITPTTAKPAVNLDNVPILDGVALAEASRNLSQKLKELTQASTATKEKTQTTPAASINNGAIIESMQHHGQGIYSGTFSGTLNPALQDREGKPKRSITTIVHILNDLLGATPQYRAQLHSKPTGHHSHPHHRGHHHHYHHHHHHHHHHHDRHTVQQERRERHHNLKATKAAGGRRMFVGERLRLSQENRATRGKMEQLQVMMEERRQRRKARREARTAPYSTWGPNRSTLAGNKLTPPASPHPTQPLKEQQQSMEVDVETSNVSENNVTDGYTELTHETVVA